MGEKEGGGRARGQRGQGAVSPRVLIHHDLHGPLVHPGEGETTLVVYLDQLCGVILRGSAGEGVWDVWRMAGGLGRLADGGSSGMRWNEPTNSLNPFKRTNEIVESV